MKNVQLFSNPLLLTICCLSALLLLSPIGYLVVRYGIPAAHLTGPLIMILIVMTGFYGIVRGCQNHPAHDAEYRQWLARTPWTAAHPLPKGPLHLVGVDLLTVTLLMVTAFLLGLTTEYPLALITVGPLVTLALGLSIAWTSANFKVGQLGHAHVVVWVPVIMALLHVPAYFFLACPFIMAAIAWHGVRRSLQTFPWPETELLNEALSTPQKRDNLLGWPLRHLLREEAEVITTPGKALMESLLAAGWIWLLVTYGALLSTEEAADVDISPGIGLLLLFTLFAAISRLTGYGPVICAKLCWGMRIANRTPIVWRHDQIFLAPLLMFMVALSIPYLLHYVAGASLAISFALSGGLIVWIARGMGPSLKELQYTGVHSRFGGISGEESKQFTTCQGSNV